jgi:hypothetical protein
VVGTGGMTASSFTKPAPPGQHPIGQGQPLPNNGQTDTAKLDRTAAKVSAAATDDNCWLLSVQCNVTA